MDLDCCGRFSCIGGCSPCVCSFLELNLKGDLGVLGDVGLRGDLGLSRKSRCWSTVLGSVSVSGSGWDFLSMLLRWAAAAAPVPIITDAGPLPFETRTQESLLFLEQCTAFSVPDLYHNSYFQTLKLVAVARAEADPVEGLCFVESNGDQLEGEDAPDGELYRRSSWWSGADQGRDQVR